ncbi:MAG: hypothetical protein ACJ75S_06520 [Solirubrobacterales bacterium]
MRGTLRIAVLIAAATLLLAGIAHAEGEAPPSRAEYVSQVEPICEANTIANKRILKDVRKKAKAGKLDAAGAQFIHSSAAFGITVGKLSEVPRPPADDERLLKWFKFLGIVQANLRKLGVALKADERVKAAHESIRVERSSNAANNVGFIFEFHYCRITPSRFT